MTIHLGYEVGTAKPVAIPLAHMAVTGMTQQSGKTTTLEALVTRSGCTAIAFITKRGEGGFTGGVRCKPCFNEGAEGRPYWEFVESLVGSVMGQKMKFERAWIVKACEGATSLQKVRDNLTRLEDDAKRSMDRDLFMLLGQYLDIVLPQIRRHHFSPVPVIVPGRLNVMDLTNFTDEMQMLLVRSAIAWVHKEGRKIVTVLPEAWKFVPEARMTPVKPVAEKLIREGAGLGNFVWMDSQDIAGVWKLMLRAASVWIVGVQREANEIKRTLANVPAGIKKPRAEQVGGLTRGQFFACWGAHVVRTYVQPAWMEEEKAKAIAAGSGDVADVAPPVSDTQTEDEDMAWKERAEAAEKRAEKLERQVAEMQQKLAAMTSPAAAPPYTPPSVPLLPTSSALTTAAAATDDAEEARYQLFKRRLTADAPALLKVLLTENEIEVKVQTRTLETEGDTLRGRIALLIVNNFFKTPQTGHAVWKELARTGSEPNKSNTYRELRTLVSYGFLTEEPGKKGESEPGFLVVQNMKSNIRRV